MKSTSNKVKRNQIKFHYLCFIVILSALTIFNLTSHIYKLKPSVIIRASQEKSDPTYFWKSFLQNNPTYKQGWIRLAKIEYDKGNYYNARMAVSKADSLDPNSEELKSLKKFLNY